MQNYLNKRHLCSSNLNLASSVLFTLDGLHSLSATALARGQILASIRN